jgi:hypothetical protein
MSPRFNRRPAKMPMAKMSCHAMGLKNQVPSTGQVGKLRENARAAK